MSCLDCGIRHGRLLCRPYACTSCQRYPLCWHCVNFATIANLAELDSPRSAAKVQSTCLACYLRLCPMDLSCSHEVVGPDESTAILTVVFAHGGGACRKSFLAHARALAKRNFRSVLLDLPRHGGRISEELTIVSAMRAIRVTTLTTCSESIQKGNLPVFFGANLGAYIGMELLSSPNGRSVSSSENDRDASSAHEWPVSTLFRGAVLAVAGQNVGGGASWRTILTLTVFDKIMQWISSEALLKLLVKDVDYSVRSGRAVLDFAVAKECSLGCGVYFQHVSEQTAVLRSTDSVAAMQRFRGPVFYAIAAEDNFPQDMADELFAVSRQAAAQARSGGDDGRDTRIAESGAEMDSGVVVRMKKYAGANRFFTHDTRYFDEFVSDVANFLDAVASLA